MKFKLLPVILIAAISIVLFSCKKEAKVNNSNIVPVNDSIYLHKIYTLYDSGTGLDTLYIITYSYDNLHRLSGGAAVVNNGAGYVPYGSLEVYYNGNDTLPVQMISYSGSTTYTDTVISFHTYDAAGNKIKDSIIKSSLHQAVYSLKNTAVNYSYAPGKIYGYSIENDLFPVPAQLIIKDTASLDANNNIIDDIRYNVTGTTEDLSLISNFTFDDHPGPYMKVNALRTLRQFPEASNILNISFNNPVTENYNKLLPTPENINSTITYQYNANDFPYVADMIYNGTLYRYVYAYTSL